MPRLWRPVLSPWLPASGKQRPPSSRSHGGNLGQLPHIFLWTGSRHHVIHAFSSCKLGDVFLNVSTVAPILNTFKVTIYSSFLAANMIIYRSLISLVGTSLLFHQALFDDNRSACSSHPGVWVSWADHQWSTLSSCALDKDAGSTLPSCGASGVF